MEVKSGKTVVTVAEDEEYKKAKLDKIPTLKPAFKPDGGSVTAANASSLNDGAAALVLTSAAKAKALGLKPIARIRGFGDAAHAPIDFPTAPSKAVPVALKNAGVSGKDIQFHEVNEAFAAVVLANAKVRDMHGGCERWCLHDDVCVRVLQNLGLDINTVNVNGGAVALGHPIG